MQTKLAVPVIRDRLVARARLFERLEEGLLHDGEFQRKLTLVAAPAGYGKTTLVAGWLHAIGLPFTWLALDETDNDPARFLAYLVAAANRLGVGNTARQAMQSPHHPPPEAVISILLNEITAYPQVFNLALDDYHVIRTPQIHKLITFFLEHQSSHVHLVLISREDPLLPIPRLSARGQALEIRQEDLRFSIDETDQFLRELMRLNLTAQDVAALEQRTEGWIAGLQLAGLAMQNLANRGNPDYKAFIQAFAGSSRFMIDYLIGEVFQQQPAGLQDFLLKTAILESLTGQLCDAVTGRDDGHALLEHLEQANLFLIPLDQAGEWFRYHQLFAEFLRHRLRLQYPLELEGLHQSASQWCEGHGFLADAVKHALSAADWDRAARLIDQAKDDMLRRGEIASLLTWYQKLPEALVHQRPNLALGYAWPLVLSGQVDATERLLASAEPLISEGSVEQGNLYAVRAYLARSRGDHDAVIHSSERALALLAQSNPSASGVLAVNLGIAYWHSGRLDETEKILSGVQQIAAQAGNPYVALTAHFFRTRVLASRGLLHRAEEQYQQIILGGTQTPILALAHYDLGTLYLEWNRLEEAQRHVTAGIEISVQTSNTEFTSSGYILLALLSLARHHPQAAMQEAEKAYQLARQLQPGVIARSESLFVQVNLAMGNTSEAVRWIENQQASADFHPFYRFLDLTPARLMVAQGRHEEASLLLHSTCQAARQNGWGYGLVAGLVLQSLAARTMNDAVESLGEALERAYPEGYLRTFLDAGPGLIPVLHEVARRGIYPDYVALILTELDSPAHPRPGALISPPATLAEPVPSQKAADLPEPLSEREREVLQLVVAGFSNREIARKLVVTPGTAKTHVHNICGKLGVRNRTEAAIRARELGLA